MFENKKPGGKFLKILSGVVIGSAIGSILGLTLAPRKGKETRRMLREKSLEMFLEGKAHIADEQRYGFWKRLLIKLLRPKKRK